MSILSLQHLAPQTKTTQHSNIYNLDCTRPNTCQNSDLNEDISSPWTYGSKSETVGQQPHKNQQLLLCAGQPQLTQPEHRLTAATRERHSTRRVGREGKLLWLIVSSRLMCQTGAQNMLTWTQQHWTEPSLWFWLHKQCVPLPPVCWSQAGLDSAWWSLIWW